MRAGRTHAETSARRHRWHAHACTSLLLLNYFLTLEPLSLSHRSLAAMYSATVAYGFLAHTRQRRGKFSPGNSPCPSSVESSQVKKPVTPSCCFFCLYSSIEAGGAADLAQGSLCCKSLGHRSQTEHGPQPTLASIAFLSAVQVSSRWQRFVEPISSRSPTDAHTSMKPSLINAFASSPSPLWAYNF